MRVRFWELEVAEVRIGHRRVVVLSGMDHERLKLPPAPFHRRDDRRHLHEIRPRADNIDHSKHCFEPQMNADKRRSIRVYLRSSAAYNLIIRALLSRRTSPFKALRVSTINGASEQTRL